MKKLRKGRAISNCAECDLCEKLDAWVYNCQKTGQKSVDDVVESGFPDWCPLSSVACVMCGEKATGDFDDGDGNPVCADCNGTIYNESGVRL